MNDARDDRLSPAEERLVGLLALLHAHEAGTSLQHAVLHRVRWQLISKHLARAIAEIAAAIADGIALVFGLSSRGKEGRS